MGALPRAAAWTTAAQGAAARAYRDAMGHEGGTHGVQDPPGGRDSADLMPPQDQPRQRVLSGVYMGEGHSGGGAFQVAQDALGGAPQTAQSGAWVSHKVEACLGLPVPTASGHISEFGTARYCRYAVKCYLGVLCQRVCTAPLLPSRLSVLNAWRLRDGSLTS